MALHRDETTMLIPIRVEDAPYVLQAMKTQANYEERVLVEYPNDPNNDLRREKIGACRALASKVEQRVNAIAAQLAVGGA